MAPFVSVLITTYNHESFIEESIDSVLSQGYDNLEIVVADDASLDRTPAIVASYAARHSNRIRAISSERNLGVSANARRAFLATRGEYVAFLSGDDVFLPGKIHAQVEFLAANHDCALCYHDVEVFESSSGEVLRYFNHGPGSQPPLEGGAGVIVRNGTFMCALSVMARRAACPPDGFDLHVPIASDWLFFIETAARGGTIRYIPRVLGRYRRHATNVTNTRTDDTEHVITISLVEARYPELAGDVRFWRARRWYGKGVEAVQNADGAAARRFFFESIHQKYISAKLAGWVLRSFATGCGPRQ